jgi:PBP1b-binding outer membrane lipoprotein LpoB
MKQPVYFLLLSIFLTSCANAGTPLPNVTATFTSTPTIVTPTEVQSTPTTAPTEIPPSLTPELNVPVTMIADLANFTKDSGWTTVTPSEFQKLVESPPVQDITVNDSIKPFYLFNKTSDTSPTKRMTAGVCAMGRIDTNLFLQYAVAVPSEHGTMHLLLFKVIVLGADGHNTIETVTFSFDDAVFDYTYILTLMKQLALGGAFQFNFITQDSMREKIENPIYQDVVGPDPARLDFENGIINEKTGYVPMKIIYVSPAPSPP